MIQPNCSNCRAGGHIKYIVLAALVIVALGGIAWYGSQNGNSLLAPADANEIDPNVVQYYERTTSVAEEARRLQALREVGGNYIDHKDSLIALKAAYKGSGMKDIDSQESWVKSADENLVPISAFNSNISVVLTRFDKAIAAWGEAIHATSAVARVESERDRDINFKAGDTFLDEALDCYTDIEGRIQSGSSE